MVDALTQMSSQVPSSIYAPPSLPEPPDPVRSTCGPLPGQSTGQPRKRRRKSKRQRQRMKARTTSIAVSDSVQVGTIEVLSPPQPISSLSSSPPAPESSATSIFSPSSGQTPRNKHERPSRRQGMIDAASQHASLPRDEWPGVDRHTLSLMTSPPDRTRSVCTLARLNFRRPAGPTEPRCSNHTGSHVILNELSDGIATVAVTGDSLTTRKPSQRDFLLHWD